MENELRMEIEALREELHRLRVALLTKAKECDEKDLQLEVLKEKYAKQIES